MACQRCGGGKRKATIINYPVYKVEDRGGNRIKVSTKSTIVLQDNLGDKALFKVGKILKVSETAATNLLSQGAPIWILT